MNRLGQLFAIVAFAAAACFPLGMNHPRRGGGIVPDAPSDGSQILNEVSPSAPPGTGGSLREPPVQQNQRPGGKGQKGSGRRRGGGKNSAQSTESVFYTEVPERAFDLILVRPTGTSVTLRILAYSEMDGTVTYGKQKGEHSAQSSPIQLQKDKPVDVVISALQPDTQYYYRLRYRERGAGEFAETAEYTFHTQRGAGSSFTFTVTADSHLDENTDPRVYERTLRNALEDMPDFHIDLGDTFMTDKYRNNYKEAFAQYLAQRYYFGLLCHSAPLFLVLGNHDGEGGSRFNGREDNIAVWSARLRKLYFPNPVPDGFYSGNPREEKYIGLLEDYYRWEWGDALFVVLDPYWYTRSRGSREGDNWNWTLGEEQYRWLEETLSGSKARFKFVFIHHLVGGGTPEARGGAEAAKFHEWGGRSMSGSYDFKEKRPGWERPIHPLLAQNRVSIVFHGHDHIYVKQDLDGIVYQLVPQPGSRRPDNTRNAVAYGYLGGDIVGAPGHMRISVDRSKVTAEYVRSYLPENEQAGRRNGSVGASYTLQTGK